jgi:hypothetical protein
LRWVAHPHGQDCSHIRSHFCLSNFYLPCTYCVPDSM